ncbi:MAG: hypothetical protein IJK08_07775 [Prevotella sp.]|nr:hypothetical protein [Prevotella sp.]
MKKMIIMAMMMTIAISASAMTYSKARTEALFLSDKMAYELGLTKSQYEAVYEINLDYLMCVSRQADVFGSYWTRRNNDLRYVLSAYQFRLYQKADYFYRPLKWQNKSLTMTVYTRYSNKSKMYRGRPSAYTSYKGGNNRGGTSYYKNKGVQKPSSHASGNKGRTSTNGKNGSTNSFDHNNTKGSHNTGIVGNGNQGRSGNGNSGNSNQGNRPQRVFR